MASDRLRVALVAPDCNKRDGQARYVAEIALGLAARGHEVHVFSVGFADTDPDAVEHHPVAAPPTAARARFFQFLWRATLTLSRHHFDVVHALGASCAAPDIITFEFCQAGWDRVLREDAPAPLAGGPIDAGLRQLIAAAERHVVHAPSVRRVIAVSAATAAEIRRHYGREEVEVIPNGVDLSRFRRRGPGPAAATDREFRVAFLGEFERKNLAVVIGAIALLDRRFVLHASGRSDPRPFARLAERLGVRDRIRFEPPTATPELFLAAADAFVFPTLYEPFGMVALEAMACATPVVLSARAGFAGWVRDGVEGRLLPDPGDARAIARHLAALAAQPTAAKAMAEAGHALAQRFAWSAVVDRTEAIYHEVVSQRRR